MAFSKEQQKTALIASIAVFILLNGYHFLTREEPKTAPLAYPRGAVASTPLRQGLQARAGGTDPLSLFIERQRQSYPGVSRDIFRMERPAAKPVTSPAPTVMTAPPLPAPPERSPEEIAQDRARADLAKFRYLGYLTEKDSTLFLSKDGELFIVKIGEMVLNAYKVKETNKDAVVLLDTATGVERRVELAGDGSQQQQPQPAPLRPPQLVQPRPQQMPQQAPPQMRQPVLVQPQIQPPAYQSPSRLQQRRMLNIRRQEQEQERQRQLRDSLGQPAPGTDLPSGPKPPPLIDDMPSQ